MTTKKEKDGQIMVRINLEKKKILFERLKEENRTVSSWIEECFDKYIADSEALDVRLLQSRINNLEAEVSYLKKLAEEKFAA